MQLYPAPTNAKVYDNVIDHAGEGFVIGNEPGYTVSGNQIFDNIITNSTGLPSENIPGQAIHDIYGGRPGTGNTFHGNVAVQQPRGPRGPHRGPRLWKHDPGSRIHEHGAPRLRDAPRQPTGAWD